MRYRHLYWMAVVRWFPAIVIGGALLARTSAGRAEITSWKLSNGSESAAGGVLADWSREIADEYELLIKHSQSGGPRQILMDFTTDTPDDPKITSINQVENDSDCSWIGYSIKVTLVTTSELTAYLISNQAVTNPTGWTAKITQPLAPKGLNGSGQYEYAGLIDLAGGTPVGNGDELDFTYLLTFAGSTSYHAIQDITPVPVPESSVFDMLAGAIVMLLLGNGAARQTNIKAN